MIDKAIPLTCFDGPALGECSRCHRKTWVISDIGAFCKISQPNGVKCEGVFVALEDVPSVTVPDEATTIRGQCPICKHVCYRIDQVATRCTFEGKNGRRCFGMFEGTLNDEEIEQININGNKVREFSLALHELAKIFDTANIIGLQELFLMGRKCETIEMVIKRQQAWSETMETISKALDSRLVSIECNQKTLKNTVALIDDVQRAISGPHYTRMVHNMETLVGLCDRLEAHRKAGMLEIVAKLTQPPL